MLKTRKAQLGVDDMLSKIVLGGRFEVTDTGEVYRIKDGVKSPAALRGACKNKKYLVTSYCENGKQKQVYVHRLVAEAFVPNPHNYPQVNHKNGDSRDNRAVNLEWCTPSQTARRAYSEALSIPMASADPCKVCGAPTRAKDGICPACKPRVKSAAHQFDKTADLHDTLSELDMSLLSDAEVKYVNQRMEGHALQEIADTYGVSKQCVHQAICNALRKNGMALKPNKTMMVDLERKRVRLSKKLLNRRLLASRLNALDAQIEMLQNDIEAYEEILPADTKSITHDQAS